MRPGTYCRALSLQEIDMSFSYTWIEAVAAASVSVVTAFTGIAWWNAPQMNTTFETVLVSPGAFDFEPTGEFVANGAEIDPGDRPVVFRRPIEIMKFQVTLGDYQRCASAGQCEAPDARYADTEAPVVGISYLDAEAYADWYSDLTGEVWRLPAPEEWAFVAAERFAGEVFTRGQDPSNPAIAWIRRYEEQILLDREPDPVIHPAGHFGPNSNGVADLGGNVWEWTSGCYTRIEQDSDGNSVGAPYQNCGIRIAEGVHRAYMSNFIRNGKSGGCAVGTPPDHLGFRLVKDAGFAFSLARLGKTVAKYLSH